jgi:hypothetical protein
MRGLRQAATFSAFIANLLETRGRHSSPGREQWRG